MALSLQLTLGGAVAQGGDRVECIGRHRRPLQRSHFSTPPVVTAPSAPARRLLLCWGHAAAHGSMLLDAGSFTVISANVEAHEEHTLARGYHGGSITNTAERHGTLSEFVFWSFTLMVLVGVVPLSRNIRCIYYILPQLLSLALLGPLSYPSVATKGGCHSVWCFFSKNFIPRGWGYAGPLLCP